MTKLTDIQNELVCQKSNFNKFGKYSYRSCEDILNAIKPILKKHNAVLVLRDEVKSINDWTYVEATAWLYVGEKTYGVSAQAGIEKAGGMQLAQAFGSASSYARKYALGGLFLIDDTKDADTQKPNEPVEEPKPKAISKKEKTAMKLCENPEMGWELILFPSEKEPFKGFSLSEVAKTGSVEPFSNVKKYLKGLESEYPLAFSRLESAINEAEKNNPNPIEK